MVCIIKIYYLLTFRKEITDSSMTSSQGNTKLFKRCPRCDFEWKTRSSFIADPDIVIIGYQTRFRNLTDGLFYFNHSCNGTMALKVDEFTDLYEGPVYEHRKTGGEDCPGHCLYKDNLDPCPAECECAYVREVIQVIKER
jgi:hypothetical protein